MCPHKDRENLWPGWMDSNPRNLLLDWKQPVYHVLYFVFFFSCFQRKKFALRPHPSCVWMTHFSKTTSWWFLMSRKYKTHISKSRSREDDFSSKFGVNERLTASFPTALHVKDNYTWRLTKQTRTRLRSSSRIWSSLLLLTADCKLKLQIQLNKINCLARVQYSCPCQFIY